MRRLLFLLAAALPAAGCALESPTVSCTGAQDCLLPLVCCAGGLAVEYGGFSGPTCLAQAECVAGGGSSAAFFPEGAPCGRVAGAEACEAGLVCCEKTLTCQTESGCQAAPVAPEVTPGEAAVCGGDSDCAEGICCGISWIQREGACRGVADCAAANGIVTPRPDAGVSGAPDAGVDGGVEASLAEQICEAAFCLPTGEKAPSGAEREACKQAFDTGVDALGRGGLSPSQACLDAVSASRALCPYLFHWRDQVVPAVAPNLPVFPGDCYAPALTQPLAGPACDQLVACGVVADRAACVGWVGGLTHDALVRVAEVASCALDRDALGFAGQPLLGKCTEDAHCPAGTACEPALAPGGVCTLLGCADPGPCSALGGVCAGGLCTLACNPRQQNVLARRAVKQACNTRVVADGRPADLGCGLQATGGAVCLPAVDPDTCVGGLEPLAGPGYGPLEHG
ncbi:MAG: hypothetical protein KC933_36630, partial [Myxococcales bacterium]|nr:hypothetical protein [Myxococcales bacterium]